MKQTETFSIPDREWRIQWKASDEVFRNAGVLQIYVYTASVRIPRHADQRSEVMSITIPK